MSLVTNTRTRARILPINSSTERERQNVVKFFFSAKVADVSIHLIDIQIEEEKENISHEEQVQIVNDLSTIYSRSE